MIDAAQTQRRTMGSDFNTALSPHGYPKSTTALYDKVDKYFQDLMLSTHRTLIESEAHTCRDLLRGSSASLDHIITLNLGRVRIHAQCKAQQAKFIGYVQNAMIMQYCAQSDENCLLRRIEIPKVKRETQEADQVS